MWDGRKIERRQDRQDKRNKRKEKKKTNSTRKGEKGERESVKKMLHACSAEAMTEACII